MPLADGSQCVLLFENFKDYFEFEVGTVRRRG